MFFRGNNRQSYEALDRKYAGWETAGGLLSLTAECAYMGFKQLSIEEMKYADLWEELTF